MNQAKIVMDKFMEKLSTGELTIEKEPIKSNEQMNEDFVESQIESYENVLKSPILNQVEELKLCRKIKETTKKTCEQPKI